LFDSLKVSTDLQITNFLAVNTVRATGDYVLRSDFLLFCLAHHRHNKIRPLRLTTVQLRLCTYYFKSEVPYALSALKIVSLITWRRHKRTLRFTASYSWGIEFDSSPARHLFWLKFFVVFL
jgi:hypothetical protein